MDGVVMEGETAETLGVVRLRRRAGELAWVRAEAEGPRSARQLVALGIDLAAGEARNLLRERSMWSARRRSGGRFVAVG